MAATFQTTFSNAYSWMKMYEFQLQFHWDLFLRVRLTIFQHLFRQWLGANQATSYCLRQWRLVYWCIHASLGLNELSKLSLMLVNGCIATFQCCVDLIDCLCHSCNAGLANLFFGEGILEHNVALTHSHSCNFLHSRSGPRLNIKTVLSTYGDFHVKDKTAVRTSYL